MGGLFLFGFSAASHYCYIDFLNYHHNIVYRMTSLFREFEHNYVFTENIVCFIVSSLNSYLYIHLILNKYYYYIIDQWDCTIDRLFVPGVL